MSNFNYSVPGDALQNDIIDNTVPNTTWQKIYLHLTKLGYAVYSPGQKRDKCISSYIVIKENGTHAMAGKVSGRKMFDIIIYHPIQNYSTMEFYVNDVKKAIDKIEELDATGNETPLVIDDEVDAYTSSVEYIQYKSLRR